jgi:branched-subunit amino acid ABC-type transport system permease component
MTLAYTIQEYVVQILIGIGDGAVLFLIASGLTLIFGALRVVNFAHGSLYMLGAFIASEIAAGVGFGNGVFWVVLLLAGLAIAAASVPLEVLFFRPIYRRPLLAQLLVTFAFVLIIAGVAREVWSAGGVSTPAPPFLQGGVKIFDAAGAVPKFEFFFMVLAVIVAVALWALLYRTGLGRMIRAAVSDPELLALSGVNVRVLFTGVFAIGCFFAGLAGGAIMLQGFIVPEIAVNAIILAFVIVVIGGLGSLSGAFIASFLVGIAQALGNFWVPEAAIAVVFAVLVAVLVVRPQGIRGTRTA